MPIAQQGCTSPNRSVAHCRSQRGFQNFVKCLNSPICLRMLWHALLVIYLEFLSEHADGFVQKMHSSITHENLRTPEPSQQIFERELCYCHDCAILNWLCFCPSSQVFARSDNIARTHLPLWFNRPGKVDRPFLKWL